MTNETNKNARPPGLKTRCAARPLYAWQVLCLAAFLAPILVSDGTETHGAPQPTPPQTRLTAALTIPI